jgi:hypothetical protein
MMHRPLATFALICAGASLMLGCDKSRQTADGTTQSGSAGSAATANGGIASTGSPEQGGANGTGPAGVPPSQTINQIDRATPDAQSPGKANADQRR